MTTRQAIAQDLRFIIKRIIALKQHQKDSTLSSHVVRLRMQRAQMKIHSKTLAKEAMADMSGMSLGRVSDDKTIFVGKIIGLLSSKSPEKQITGIEHWAMDGTKILKFASTQDSERLSELLLSHLFSPHMSVRKVAASAAAQVGTLFHTVPVVAVPPIPEPNNPDPDAHTQYDVAKADNQMLSKVCCACIGAVYDLCMLVAQI
jgi:hypothetical protein